MQTNLEFLIIEIDNLIQNFCERNSCKVHNFYVNYDDTLDGQGNQVGKNFQLKYYFRDLQPKAEGSILRVED